MDHETEERAPTARVEAHRQGQPTPLTRALDVTGDRWTLSIAMQLASGHKRPVQLQRELTGLSSAVLDRRLRRMVACGLLRRRRFREMPPRVEVELTEAGRALVPIAKELAHWAVRHIDERP